MLYSVLECSFLLIAIHGVKFYSQCFTRSEAIFSLLYKE